MYITSFGIQSGSPHFCFKPNSLHSELKDLEVTADELMQEEKKKWLYKIKCHPPHITSLPF